MSVDPLVSRAVRGFAEALQPLNRALSSAPFLSTFLDDLGWELAPDADLTRVAVALAPLRQALTSLLGLLQQGLGAADLAPAIQAVVAAVRALEEVQVDASWPAPLSDPVFWGSLAAELPSELLAQQLAASQPLLYGVLRALGLLEEQVQNGSGSRSTHVRRRVRWDRLASLAEDPRRSLADLYGWGGTFDHDRLLANLQALMQGLGGNAWHFVPADATVLGVYYDPGAPSLAQVGEVDLMLFWSTAALGTDLDELDADLDLVVLPIPPSGSRTAAPIGIAVFPWLVVGAGTQFQVADGCQLTLSGGFEASVIHLEIRPGSTSVTGSALPDRLSAEARLDAQPALPWALLGSADASRVEVAAGHVRLSASGPPASPEVRFEVGADAARLVLDLGEGDGFVRSAIGSGLDGVDLGPLSIVWSSQTGLRFGAASTLATILPVHVSLAGVLDVDVVRVAASRNAEAGATDIDVTLSGALQLGPLRASLDQVGLRLRLSPALPPQPPGNLGDLALDFAFKPPTGVGLTIDASAVTGGGFLSFDQQRQEYAGVLELEVADAFSVKAIAVLSTQNGFSLMGLVFVDGFTPIQIGFGFTLNGVGGMFAINRTVAVDVLRAGLKSHRLDSLLFPPDPVGSARQIISDLDAIFPRADGRYLFGPMAEIGWGEPALVTIRLALLLELPAPVRLILLGQLEALLPSPDERIVQLHMDAVGVIDFDRGTVALDAVLYDSRLMDFALTGAMALRAGWGSERTLVLAIGGLHPHFQPPPAFPALERVAIALASGDGPRLRLEAYLALTSNTVQFGAHLDLHASAGSFALDGHLGLDTLIHFEPFAFVADVSGLLTLSYDSAPVLSVGLEMSLSGPSPWHARGTATFEVLGLQQSISFDNTFGPALPPAPAAVPQVEQRLVAALGDPRSWSSPLPASVHPPVGLRPLQAQAQEVLAHPLGRLTVHQREVPLELAISRFGTVPLPAPLTFHVDPASVQVGGLAADPAPSPVEDYFASGQFRDLSDEERLSRPSFERYQSGLQFGLAGHLPGVPQGSGLAYATVVVDPLAPTVPTPKMALASQPATDQYQVPNDSLAALIPSGAAARAPFRSIGRTRFAAPPRPLAAAPASFTVANTDDLKAQPGTAIPQGAFVTYTQAADALQRYLAGHPEQRGRLQVVTRQEHRRSDLPPLTSLAVGMPHHLAPTATVVGPATPITLGPAAGVSLRSLSYRVYPQGVPAPRFSTAGATTATFALGGADGPRHLDYFGIDTADGQEDRRAAVLVVDGSAPQSTLALGAPVPGVGVPALVTAVDSGAGVASIAYRVYPQGAAAPAFTVVGGAAASFTVSGPEATYQVDYLATDNVGNTEAVRSQLVPLDTTPPQSTLVIGAPGFPADAPQFVTGGTRLTLSATDDGSGVRSVSYRAFAHGGAVPPYVTSAGSQASFRVGGADGAYDVQYYATDSAGNVEAVHTRSVTVDGSPPHSSLAVGAPRFPPANPAFVSGATPLALTAVDAGAGVGSVSYRAYPLGTAAPAYTTVQGASATLRLAGADGAYQVDMFATDVLGNAEPAHGVVLSLDGTPPAIAIAQPAAGSYPQNSTLTLGYAVGDGAGSGLASVTPTLDAAGSVGGHGLASGQVIDLSTELGLGVHTFAITAVDNVGNATSASVQFTVVKAS